MDAVKLREVISNNLSKTEKVNRYDTKEEKEAATLTHCFMDLKESFDAFQEIYQKLIQSNISKEDVEEILFDIGEEFRHILYHIKDPKYYDYLER